MGRAGICVRRDDIVPEGEQRAYLEGLGLSNRPVDVSGGHPSLRRWPKRSFIEPERFGPLLRAQKRIRADSVARLFRELAVGPACVERARQRI
jgi:hypothetical protein